MNRYNPEPFKIPAVVSLIVNDIVWWLGHTSAHQAMSGWQSEPGFQGVEHRWQLDESTLDPFRLQSRSRRRALSSSTTRISQRRRRKN
jgi:hypothetical protein